MKTITIETFTLEELENAIQEELNESAINMSVGDAYRVAIFWAHVELRLKHKSKDEVVNE